MTNGIVSVIVDGKMAIKFITGCDGMQAKELANAVRQKLPESIGAAYVLAMAHGFGCADCLVVMTPDATYPEELDVPDRYRATFNDPEFNPRWEYGTADYTEVVPIAGGKR